MQTDTQTHKHRHTQHYWARRRIRTQATDLTTLPWSKIFGQYMEHVKHCIPIHCIYTDLEIYRHTNTQIDTHKHTYTDRQTQTHTNTRASRKWRRYVFGYWNMAYYARKQLIWQHCCASKIAIVFALQTQTRRDFLQCRCYWDVCNSDLWWWCYGRHEGLEGTCWDCKFVTEVLSHS